MSAIFGVRTPLQIATGGNSIGLNEISVSCLLVSPNATKIPREAEAKNSCAPFSSSYGHGSRLAYNYDVMNESPSIFTDAVK